MAHLPPPSLTHLHDGSLHGAEGLVWTQVPFWVRCEHISNGLLQSGEGVRRNDSPAAPPPLPTHTHTQASPPTNLRAAERVPDDGVDELRGMVANGAVKHTEERDVLTAVHLRDDEASVLSCGEGARRGGEATVPV